MILSVTARTSMDHISFIDTFEMNRTLRATQVIECMGGKPTNASCVLADLGNPVLALGFVAGHTGQRIDEMLREHGITTDFVQVDGASRRNIAIICNDGSGQTSITPNTLKVNDEHIAALFQKIEDSLDKASVVITGGSLPGSMEPSFYAELIKIAAQHDVPVVLDVAGDNLRAGLKAGAAFIKPNDEEIGALVGEPIESFDAAYHAGRQIYDTYGAESVITFGSRGALAVLADCAYRIPPLSVKVINYLGAGDSVAAGLAHAVHNQLPIEDGLRVGIASASATLQTPATADIGSKEIVEQLAQQVELIPYEVSASG